MGAHIGALVEVEYVLEGQDPALSVECSAGPTKFTLLPEASHDTSVEAGAKEA